MSAVDAVEIAGRYRILRRLGYGGMSTVHLAMDQRLERQVAVKLLAEHLADDPAFVSRFQREAQAAARLIHPNIVQIFDSGLDDRAGQHFIVMEYIEGSSCAEILRDQGWVEVAAAVSLIEQACEGLDYAHRHGVVHRDVKPGNLLRSREGQLKLADFGIAKAAEQSSITQVGSVLGTAAYLAPEQARGQEAGPSADLYALGVVSYQLISGRLPYEAGSLTELALKQQQQAPARLDALVAAVTPELADAVAIALALDPSERFPNAGEMAAAVRDGARGMARPRARTDGSRPDPASSAGEPTHATRLLVRRGRRGSGSEPRTSGTKMLDRPARPLAATRARPVSAAQREQMPASAAPTSRRRRGRGLFAGLFALLVLAAAIAVVVLATAPAHTRVTLRNVVYQDVERAAGSLKQLVSENTK